MRYANIYIYIFVLHRSFFQQPRANNARAYTNVFQSTPPREGRHKAFEAYTKFIKFQSTPPREGRHKAFEAYTKFIKFQSTPPREGRRKKRPIYKARLGFNPRPHTRGDIFLDLVYQA